MNIKEILKSARANDIDISVSGNNLQIKSEKPGVPPALLEDIKRNKAEIIAYLKEQLVDTGRFQSIPGSVSKSGYPLSSSQLRIWVQSQFSEAATAYNLPEGFIFEGRLNLEALAFAFSSLLQRHEILRTVFRENGEGETRQYVLPLQEVDNHIGVHDLRQATNAEQLLQQLVQSEASMPFDLSTGPLLRVNLYRLNDERSVLTYTIHHIICDGWSMSIIIKELFLLYNTHLQGKNDPLPPLRIQYKDYAVWQQQQLSGERARTEREYWLNQFKGDLPVMDIPGSKPRPAIKSYNGQAVNFVIEPGLTARVKTLGKEQGCTMFMSLMAAIVTLLYRYTGQEDMIIGTPIAGRDHADLEDQIGFYVNTLALRIGVGGTDSSRELLEKVKKVTVGAYEHQLYPFNELVNDLRLRRDTGRHPLFDIEVIWQFTDAGSPGTKGVEALTITEYNGMEKYAGVFDLVFKFVEIGGALHTSIIFNTDIFNRPIIERLGQHLERMLHSIADAPDDQLSCLNYLATGEQQLQLKEFNDTGFDFPGDKMLIDLFEENVLSTPDATAVVFENKVLTYRELNDAATCVAAYLQSDAGVKKNDLVCIMLDRSEKAIIALLAVLKAGAAFVPIDPSYPETRKKFIIGDTGSRLLITDEKYFDSLEQFTGTIITPGHWPQNMVDAPAYKRPVTRLHDLAYVIYTSGSTGQPKGVLIEQNAILNTVYSQKKIFGIRPHERGLQFSSLSFDASVWEIFMILSAGAALFIADEETKKNPILLEEFITGNNIAVATLPPVVFGVLETEKISSLRILITAGEAALRDKAVAFSTSGEFYNAYGPTESAICATVYKLPAGYSQGTNSLPIGKPLPNVQVYIVDEYLNLLPVGATGEICIGGKGIARGYLNNETLTAEKFIADPFTPGGRLYRTGDIGKYLPDGNIEFCGRKDDQVKRHGYRIEPGEIEAVLQTHPGINAAAVVVRSREDGQKDLVAFLVANNGQNTADIRGWLAKQLPHYLLPDYYIDLDSLPVTTNGKTDRKKLAGLAMPGSEATTTYIAPVGKTEEKLVEIWQTLLGRQKIGVRDNFFEAGGNSISIINLCAMINKTFDRDLSLDILFQYANIEELSRYIDGQPPVEAEELVDDAALVQELNKFNIGSDVNN